MYPIKEVTIFAGGNIFDINTWSGVPFFFCKALQEKGININNVDIAISSRKERIIEFIYNKLTGPVVIKILHNFRADYTTSVLRHSIIRNKIKQAVLKYPYSDCLIFFSFTCSATGISKIPSIMISDWTLDYWIRFIRRSPPRFFERKILRHDDKQIESANVIFSIFPGITEYLRTKYKNRNIFYLGNAVNSIRKPPENFQGMIANKQQQKKLLFIGGRKYLGGLYDLIDALKILKNEFDNISIHVIGIKKEDIYNYHEIDSDIDWIEGGGGVFFYGYLDKNIPSDCDIYYSLLQEAALYINTTPMWSAFQAPVEAMYFYTPAIISPNAEFLMTFGSGIEKCCIFSTQNTVLTSLIKDTLNNENYKLMCENAHLMVKNFTWDIVAGNFLKTLASVFRTE
jgi:glycosyltransferase involved in cell wall biosynthesis